MKTMQVRIAWAFGAAACVSAAMGQGAFAQASVENLGERVSISIPVAQNKEAPIETGLAAVIGAQFPLSVAFSDLGAGWRELSHRGRVYFTKGDTKTVAETEYLIAYAYDPGAPDNVGSRAKSSAEANEKQFIAGITGNAQGAGYAPGDRFALTLLSMRQVLPSVSEGSIGLRSFNPAAYRSTSKFDPPLDNAGYRQQLSLVYLARINEAASAYSNTYLDVMPPTQTAFATRQALLPFAGNGYVFNVPGTNQPFKVNPVLSEKKRAHLRRRRGVVFYYQDPPAEDGLRAVLLLNGTTQRIDADAWKRLKKSSDIPD